MIPLSLIFLDNIPIYAQLQLEEALLRADARNWCLINSGSTPAIVMGISGKPELLVNRALLAEKPIPLIKRFSGGGTVIVDENTFFITWICNAGDVEVACCPQKIHRWTEGVYQAALPTVNLRLRENDYAIGERKFGGNAQYLCKGRWLHHSSLLWDYQPEMMNYLLMPPKMPSYRLNRTHHDFLCRLCEHLPDQRALKHQIVQEMRQRFEVKEVGMQEVLEIIQRPHRRATEYVSF